MMMMAGYPAFIILVLAAPAIIADDLSDAALAADDECAAGFAGEEACGLQALQVRAGQQEELAELETKIRKEHGADLSEGMKCIPEKGQFAPWCGTMSNFSKLFDTNDPAQMQQAVDMFCKFHTEHEGITIALTKRDYYLMYHDHVERVLKTYLSTGCFAWHMGDTFKQIGAPKDGTVHIVRDGTFKLALGWRRPLFTASVMRQLPHGMTFPFSTVDELEDCAECPAKFIFTLKRVGLAGTEHDWMITEILLVKLAKPKVGTSK